MSAYGTIFKVDAKGHETTLYNFTGGTDGGEPDSTLIQDSAGYLYGTTYRGGAYGLGTVFKVDTAGNLTVLFSFSGYSTGYFPFGGLIRDASAMLRAIFMERPKPAVVFTERFSNWMPVAMRRCFIASTVPMTADFPKPAWLQTMPATSMAPPRQGDRLAERCMRSLPRARSARCTALGTIQCRFPA
jgi:uncharacterized repeat protein (TIGR03803 family)